MQFYYLTYVYVASTELEISSEISFARYVAIKLFKIQVKSTIKGNLFILDTMHSSVQ